MFATLEISVRHIGEKLYHIESRFSTDLEGEDKFAEEQSWMPWDKLPTNLDDPKAQVSYGLKLWDYLFPKTLQSQFVAAYAHVGTQDGPDSLRINLMLQSNAEELHSLHWELLRRPEADGKSRLIATDEKILFSRYLKGSGLDWRNVTLRRRSNLRALIAIANPENLKSYNLAPIDVEGELQRARESLADMFQKALISSSQADLNPEWVKPVTLANLIQCLREEDFDIVYLVCHGRFSEGQGYLYLDDKTPVSALEFAKKLRDLPKLPTMIILASCQSAGSREQSHSEDKGSLASVGPRLAEAGIPAVLAMQGNVTMNSIKNFMPEFFNQLRRNGSVDRAVAVARSKIQDRLDWYVPVLFSRLRYGIIWYTPGFQTEKRFPWKAMWQNVDAGECVPILGPNLVESFLGSRSTIAKNWAKANEYPLEPHDSENLPEVAQYLAMTQQLTFPKNEFEIYLRREILAKYTNSSLDNAMSLDTIIREVGKTLREKDANEPHKLLAELQQPVYLNANISSLLEDALREKVRGDVDVDVCDWKGQIRNRYSNSEFKPSRNRPLIYHLFGHLDDKERFGVRERLSTLVLTEDDYFDYMISASYNRRNIPKEVVKALKTKSLLFLGFELDDWTFRVLFRLVMSLTNLPALGNNVFGGSSNTVNEEHEEDENLGINLQKVHVAVQVNPSDDRFKDADGARQYLEKSFGLPNMSVYWGTAIDFLRELHEKRPLTAAA